jgi:hypothetical protein
MPPSNTCLVLLLLLLLLKPPGVLLLVLCGCLPTVNTGLLLGVLRPSGGGEAAVAVAGLPGTSPEATLPWLLPRPAAAAAAAAAGTPVGEGAALPITSFGPAPLALTRGAVKECTTSS